MSDAEQRTPELHLLGVRSQECRFYPLPIPLALVISRRLRLGTGQRVKDTQPQQRQEMIEFNHVPEEALIDFVRITGT